MLNHCFARELTTGQAKGDLLRLRLKRIGRSNDDAHLPVHDVPEIIGADGVDRWTELTYDA
jgi:hypothetical protein